MDYTLFYAPHTGSDIALGVLRASGAPHKLVRLSYELTRKGQEPRLKKVNPLSRLPTLVLPNGQVLTESGAILLHLHAAYPKAGLAPKAGTPDYDRFLRILFILTGEIYPCFTFVDDPSEWVSAKSARRPYALAIGKHRKELWKYVESLLAPRGPWALGKKWSGLDLYLAQMTSWRPGPEWFAKSTPRIAAIRRRSQPSS